MKATLDVNVEVTFVMSLDQARWLRDQLVDLPMDGLRGHREVFIESIFSALCELDDVESLHHKINEAI